MPKTIEELENLLTLATASDEAIEAAKKNRIMTDLLTPNDCEYEILRAVIPRESLQFHSGGEWLNSSNELTFARNTVYRLNPDFQRPVITPDDLPEDMREKFEEGIQKKYATELEIKLFDYFHQTCPEKIEWKHASDWTVDEERYLPMPECPPSIFCRLRGVSDEPTTDPLLAETKKQITALYAEIEHRLASLTCERCGGKIDPQSGTVVFGENRQFTGILCNKCCKKGATK